MKRIQNVKLLLLLALVFLMTGFVRTELAYGSSYVINDNGGSCFQIGMWDYNTKTCTLTANLFSSGQSTLLEINGSDITVEGNGMNLSSSQAISEFIRFNNATGCTVRNLTFMSSSPVGQGIALTMSNGNTAENLNFHSAMVDYAIVLGGSDNNTIRNVWTNDSSGAILLDFSNNNTFDSNVFLDVMDDGIEFLSSSSYNVFTNNTLHTLGRGVYMGYGGSNYNEFYLNSFIGFTRPVFAVTTEGMVYINNELIGMYGFMRDFPLGQFSDVPPIGGNYYSILAGCSDGNGDNFCDVPYLIDAGYSLYDWYPWVAPTFITDIDIDGFRAGLDCNDNDMNISPIASEIPHNGIDENCNGMEDDDDLDHDGYGYLEDCNDVNPDIHPGATEVPYNGIDENCNGMADDNDLDFDGYGYPTDCNDGDPAINPSAAEIVYNGVDENCNGMADDDDLDIDGYGIATDCNENDPAINPGATEIPYNSIDENCNGMTDDSDFDLDGYEYTVDCNDNDPAINPGAAEIPYNSIDENCNGMVDDDDLDSDSYGIALDCNDGDPAINPDATEITYNGIDENCNGMTDDDDLDVDGYGIATDCNESDPAINPGASEIPYNSIDENCNGMSDDDDLDTDGYGIATDCNESNPNINPGMSEIPYNGIDENCNGMADDTDFDLDGYDNIADCNDNDAAINPGATEIKHDGIDQDCNGYDLTIDIVSTDYKSGPDKLSVAATSDNGASANLVIDGYGVSMTWNNKKSQWEGTVQPAGGNPGTVTVSGFEGAESAPVN